jgi:hypothetical protein
MLSVISRFIFNYNPSTLKRYSRTIHIEFYNQLYLFRARTFQFKPTTKTRSETEIRLVTAVIVACDIGFVSDSRK